MTRHDKGPRTITKVMMGWRNFSFQDHLEVHDFPCMNILVPSSPTSAPITVLKLLGCNLSTQYTVFQSWVQQSLYSSETITMHV